MITEDKPLFTRKTWSLHDLGNYGIETLAYIKPVTVDGHLYHSIHAADGTPLTVMAERDEAFATVRQHNLVPNSVH
jgi:acyl dehydratase